MAIAAGPKYSVRRSTVLLRDFARPALRVRMRIAMVPQVSPRHWSVCQIASFQSLGLALRLGETREEDVVLQMDVLHQVFRKPFRANIEGLP